MTKDLSRLKLNKEQIDAIKFGSGPLLIIAGAGTGKTTVVTERIKYLILGKKAKPNEILALTFTEKAAREMEERVDVGLPYGYTQMWLMTFHSFCDRILRAEALHIGLDPRYKLMTEAESVQLIRKNLFKLDLDYFRPLGNPNKFIGGMLQHFSRLQDEDVTPNDYMIWVESEEKKLSKNSTDDEKLEIDKWKELSRVYKSYDELKVREGVMDFGDLIVKTLKLFRNRPNLLREYQKQFKYILVDEFQDTNFAQNELVKLLVGKKGNITVVADDDQSIYRFRGAAVSNVIQFRKSFPKTKVVTLTKNYRSTQEILDRSYELIQFNNPDRLEVVEKIDKKLKSQVSKNGEEIEFIKADRVENEADLIARKVEELTTEKKYTYKDFAILVRANNHAEPIMRAFLRHSIPYQFLGPGRLFKQNEIIDLISYLKVLNNFEDSISFYRILSMDFFDIEPRDLAAIGNFAKKNNLSLFEATEKVEEIRVSDKTKISVKKLLEVIKDHLGKVKKETAGQLLYHFLSDTGLIQQLLSPDDPASEKRAKNISKFFDKLKSYEADHLDSTVSSVVDWLDLAMELGESPLATDSDWGEVNAVNILTTHSAKGLEFPVVFIVNLVSQRFPTIERREQIPIPAKLIKEILPVGDYHLEEERRLFYVAMTRAKEKLFLTAANYYGEGKREKKLSPFIFEALGDRVVASEIKTSGEQLSFLDYKPNEAKESKVEIPKLKIDYLSYSQIETFKICPLHYKLRYLLKVPTDPSPSQSFGTSIHATLKDFYTELKNGNKANEKILLDIYERNWITQGFSSKKHELDFKSKGKDYLLGFLKNNFDPKIIPESMEESFLIPLTLKGESVKIGGKIDRVDIVKNKCIEIIDYKTGATLPTQRDVDNNLQLSFYALAATKIPFPPFSKKCEEIELSLYFLDQQKKMTTTRNVKDLDKAVEEIFKTKKEIENSDFKCSGHMFCQTNCEYSLFCRSEH